jgi:hypothetical protein
LHATFPEFEGGMLKRQITVDKRFLQGKGTEEVPRAKRFSPLIFR